MEQINAFEAKVPAEFGFDPADPVPRSDPFLKIALQQFEWHRLDRSHGINALAGIGQNAMGYVGGHNLPSHAGMGPQELGHNDGHGVGLLTGGGCRRPKTQGGVRRR